MESKASCRPGKRSTTEPPNIFKPREIRLVQKHRITLSTAFCLFYFVLFCFIWVPHPTPPPLSLSHTHTLASFYSTVLSSGPGDQRPAQNPMLHWVLVPSTLLPCVMVQFSFFPNFDILKTTIQAFCRLPVSLGWSDVLLLRIKGQTSLARTPRKWCCVHCGVSFCLVTGDEVELIRLLVYFPL